MATRRSGRARVARLLLILGLVAGCGGRAPAEPPGPEPPPDSLPPLAHPPMDPPLEVTATFGEFRGGHFHAGLDFSTDLRIGRPVYAPLAGWVEEIRASGGGYGRSIVLRAPDGRKVLLAHLDAFEEPVASWLAAIQDSTGQYEQEVRLAPERIPITAGQRIAWSGESGAGPPHLHMEVRWGDMAYNPLRNGLVLPDTSPPVLRRVTLEPVDSESYVDGSAAPRTYSLGLPPDTIVVEGGVRLWLDARDGVSDPWPRVAPYAARLETDGEVIECRFDRIPWDEDMTAVEWVYDATFRAGPGQPIALWIAEDYRPAVFTQPTRPGAAGVVRLGPGAPARAVVVASLDAAGNRSEQRLMLRGPRPGEEGPGSRVTTRRARRRGFELYPSAEGHLRVSYAGAPPGARGVTIGWEGAEKRRASFDGARWTAILGSAPGRTALVAAGRSRAGEAWEARHAIELVELSSDRSVEMSVPGVPGALWSLPEKGVFSRSFAVADTAERASPLPGLVPHGLSFGIGPARLPLRRAANVVFPLPAAAPDERVGVYHEEEGRWAYAGGSVQGGAAISARTRGPGRFAVFADHEPPRIAAARTRRRALGAAHGRWSLQSGIVERGSGVDAARTYFVVDDRRVPSEWETERAVLRWRPLQPPGAGTHRYELVATDRAGNASRQSGVFTAP